MFSWSFLGNIPIWTALMAEWRSDRRNKLGRDTMTEIIERTVDAVRRNIEDIETASLSPEYYYHSLPLCIIDAVFSIGVRYICAQRAVDSWCGAHEPRWTKFRCDDQPSKNVSDLIDAIKGHTDLELSNRFFGGNKQRTSTRNGILKAGAVKRFASALVAAEIEDFHDVLDVQKITSARTAILTIPGQRSGISFDYFRMLAGNDGFVKADRMICRFVAHAAGRQVVTAEQAREAVIGACGLLVFEFPNLTPRLLDHLIWRYQRNV